MFDSGCLTTLWEPVFGNANVASTVVPPNTADLGTDEKAAKFGNRRSWGGGGGGALLKRCAFNRRSTDLVILKKKCNFSKKDFGKKNGKKKCSPFFS